ncbi:MAG: arsenite methyltransferase [Calditrichia bacterium]
MKNRPWNKKTIKEMVKNRYGSLIQQKDGGCCAGSASDCGCFSPQAEQTVPPLVEYPGEELNGIPADAVTHSFGCGNPLAFAEVEAGQTVLDIGSGAGIDCFLAAKMVGPDGRVIGVDMTPEMIHRARANAEAGNFHNVEFRLGEADHLPVGDESVDWIISNCVINLAPDKPAVFREIARVLRPGGRFIISDIVLSDNLPEAITRNVFAWTSCLAGAITENEYLQGLIQAGLNDVCIESRFPLERNVILSFLKSEDFEADNLNRILDQITGKVWSAKIRGKK